MRQGGKDLLLAIALFSVGLGALLYIQLGPGEALQTSRDAQITFRSFPTVISMLLMLLSVLYAVRVIVATISELDAKQIGVVEDVATGDPTGLRRPRYLFARMAALVLLLLAFSQVLGTAPFFLLAGAFLAVAFVIFGQTHPGKILVVAVLGGALFHGLFVSILKLPLY